MNKALIVVDMQNCFNTNHTSHLPQMINKRIQSGEYDEIAFTKFINNSKSNFYAHGYGKCMESPENEICPELLDIAKKHKIFEKSEFSAFKANGLVAWLKKNNITKVHICGTDTDACVMATAYDAFDHGFKVEVLYDLCASCNGSEFHEAAEKIMKRNLGFLKK